MRDWLKFDARALLPNVIGSLIAAGLLALGAYIVSIVPSYVWVVGGVGFVLAFAASLLVPYLWRRARTPRPARPGVAVTVPASLREEAFQIVREGRAYLANVDPETQALDFHRLFYRRIRAVKEEMGRHGFQVEWPPAVGDLIRIDRLQHILNQLSAEAGKLREDIPASAGSRD